MRRPRSRFLPRFVLLGGGVVAACLIGEGLARSVQTSFELANFDLAGGGNRPGCVRPSVSRGYEPVPGACGVDDNAARVYRAGASSPNSTLRVMVVGDSLSTQTVWPAELVGALAAGWDRPVELQAYGVPGYNTCQELSMYREKVAAFAPHLVLFQACANDARGSPVLVSRQGRTRYYMDGDAVEFPSWFLHSRLLTLLELRYGARLPVPELGSGVERTRDCLADLAAAAAQRETPLLTTLFPLFWARGDAPAPMLADEDDMRGLLQASGLPFLDLRPPYEAAGAMPDHRDSPTDFIHPSAAGQRVASGALSAWILGSVPELPAAP